MIYTWAIVTVVLVYIWLIVPLLGSGPILGSLPTVLVLAIAFAHAIRRREWGLSWTALLPALLWAALLTLPFLALLWGVGHGLDTLRSRPRALQDFFFFALWGTGQQFALQTVFLREAQSRYSGGRAILAAAALFAALHLPNVFLVALTFVGGLAYCWIFSRHSNVLPLGVAHALTSLVVIQTLSRDLTASMRVGYSCLRFWGVVE